jgi:hypothetical protein
MDKNKDIQMEAIDERIDKYIRGIMTEEEETSFKNEIKADPELRSHVLATLSLIKGIRKQDAAKEKELIHNNTQNRVRTLLWWACSIAAVFAFFFGYQKDRRFNELSNIVSPYYAEYSMSDYARGDLDSVTAAHLYTLFNQIKEQRDMSDIINELEPIYASLDSDITYNAYANDIAWNLALAYIKDDQTDKAIPVLEKLVEDNIDTPIALKAKELLKEIKKLE